MLYLHISIYWPTAHFANKFGTQRPLLNKKMFDHFYIWADVRHCLFFAKSNHIIHACRRYLNTSLICPHIRMVIQLISTSVLTSPPYFTNYDSTYLQHFTVKMHEYPSGSELKLAIWRQMRMHAKKYFDRKNMIWLKWSWPAPNGPITSRILFEVWFLPSVDFSMFTCVTFSTFYVIFAAFRALFEESTPFKKWLYHLFPPPPLLPHLDLL